VRRAPSGYAFGRDAFDAIAHEKFGQAWTGALEYRARSGLWTIAEYERAKVTAGSGMSGSGSGASGISFAPAWLPDEPLSKEYQAEREAHDRYVNAEEEFISRLEAGRLAASVLNTWTGKIKPIRCDFWRTSEAYQAVRHGIGPGGQGTLLISLPLSSAIEAPEKQNPPQKLGGAPPAADWPEFEKALEEEIDLIGFPAKDGPKGWRSKADVIRWIEARLGPDEEPGKTALKENVNRMLENIKNRLAENQ
jgi:hypothetical protein